jgi:hypothetical protein
VIKIPWIFEKPGTPEFEIPYAAWRLHHPDRKKSVKIHHSMHDLQVWERNHIAHGIRHTILRPAFWFGMTMGFPLEHLLWEKAPVFSAITRWLGL